MKADSLGGGASRARGAEEMATALADAGVDVDVARGVAQVRVQRVATQGALALHAAALQYARGADVFDVAERPHAHDVGQREDGVDHGRGGLTHIALVPG